MCREHSMPQKLSDLQYVNYAKLIKVFQNAKVSQNREICESKGAFHSTKNSGFRGDTLTS